MQINHLEKFLERIAAGEMPAGCCITCGDPTVTEIAADAGFDFCWIDCEHGIIDRTQLMLHIMALRGTDCAPLVRVPCCEHVEIKKVIDLAPAGIIVPMVNSAADAERAVSACRYPLRGDRGCSLRRVIRYGADPVERYLAQAEKEPLVILQMEHFQAVRNLDAILAVPGVDSICIGPYDLSSSVGKPGRFNDPEVSGMIDEICRKTRAAGVLLGAYGESDFEHWRQRGVQYMGIVNDTGALFQGFREQLGRFHRS